MTDRTELGKIRDVKYGFGGRDNAMWGLTVELGGWGWGTTYFSGMWAIEPTGREKWSKSDQEAEYLKTVEFLQQIMRDANVNDVKDLIGTPIEAYFESAMIKGFRVLTECI